MNLENFTLLGLILSYLAAYLLTLSIICVCLIYSAKTIPYLARMSRFATIYLTIKAHNKSGTLPEGTGLVSRWLLNNDQPAAKELYNDLKIYFDHE